MLEKFATFKKNICNYFPTSHNAAAQSSLIFDRSITQINPSNKTNCSLVTFDSHIQKWHEQARPWVLLYKPKKKFDDFLCNDCTQFAAPGQAEWTTEYTRIGGDTGQQTSSQAFIYEKCQKLEFYSSPQSLSELTDRSDQCFVHNGTTLLAFVSWTPLLCNYRHSCYICNTHPTIPQVSIYVNPTLEESERISLIAATKDTLYKHIHYTQSHRTALINQLCDSLRYETIRINEESSLTSIVFKIYSMQKVLKMNLRMVHKEKKVVQVSEFLKTPGLTYPTYELKKIEKDKVEFLQNIRDKSNLFMMETLSPHLYTSKSIDDYIALAESSKDLFIYGIYATSKSNNNLAEGSSIEQLLNTAFEKHFPSIHGCMIVHKDHQLNKDLLVFSAHKKEPDFNVFHNYQEAIQPRINKFMLWQVYKNLWEYHPLIKPTDFHWQYPTKDKLTKALFTFMKN